MVLYVYYAFLHINGQIFGVDWCFDMTAEVNLYTLSLGELFSNKEGYLCIPDYQRTYCWLPKNVYKLLDDIWNLNKVYRLGCVILQRKNGHLNIIDGQQRLVTLSLILAELGENNISLLDQQIESEEAIEYIAYNKFLIKNYVARYRLSEEQQKCKVDKLKEYLNFSVLILEDASLDLAYTFFSSQNSKGVKLTSYELLKSHHLHFIPNEQQAVHLAKRWDAILNDKESDERIDVTMGKYLFYMRKWLYRKDWNEKADLKVKEEFESAMTIPEIPPFGEKFIFNEPIQGGTHFFAYTDHFINRCREFHQTAVYKSVHKIVGETHVWFRDVMEALLFAYYLKFGDSYMAEALICISKIISQYRYESRRIELKPLLDSDRNNMIILMIDQASSPTFFLASCRDFYNKMEVLDMDRAPIMKRYTCLLKQSLNEVRPLIVSSTFMEECYEGR